MSKITTTGPASNSHSSKKSATQLTTLVELAAILNSSLEPKEVRKRAMQSATRLMNCEVGSLLLLNEEKKELFFEVALGDKGEAVKEIRLKIGEGIAGWVAEHRTPLMVADVTKDSRHSMKVDDKSGYKTKNIICVPVMVKQKVIGVLQAINKLNNEHFSNEDLELFKLLSNQVAIAIENAILYEKIHTAFLEVSEALAESIEKRDPYTGGHTKRVLAYSMAIAKHIKLHDDEVEKLKIAAILHDIGKIGVEDKILRKKEKLTDEEYQEMKKHPIFGVEILGNIKQLKDIIPGMHYHHERTDGKGYPNGLKGNNIPLIARIISVADTYDAMTTNRPYHDGFSNSKAIAELKRCTGSQFDKDVVDAFIKAFENNEIRAGAENNTTLLNSNHKNS
ncbi:MAG: HD domain-containing protein [Deltaproteobacteria bacterium]|nr:HD domain-containing protein [Deltaproteobacteria bacterium]